MRDITRLMDAVWEVYNLSIPFKKPGERKNLFEPWQDKNGHWHTHCNEAFNRVALRMGYEKFDRRETAYATDAQLANRIYEVMNDGTGDWRQIDGILGSRMATAGYLVAAIDANDDRPGHVCVVLPGLPEQSGSFGFAVPKVLNVGKDVFIGRRASYAFAVADKPRYFCLKVDFTEFEAGMKAE